ncbi:uncharacterized protein J3R85_006114 [Psidium guajava]|nr:uncharacterized protein J3R85_006114 [Psidium guajava]
MATRSTIFAITVIAVLLMAHAASATPECVQQCVAFCMASGRSKLVCAKDCTVACYKVRRLNGFDDWGWGWGLDKRVPPPIHKNP